MLNCKFLSYKLNLLCQISGMSCEAGASKAALFVGNLPVQMIDLSAFCGYAEPDLIGVST